MFNSLAMSGMVLWSTTCFSNTSFCFSGNWERISFKRCCNSSSGSSSVIFENSIASIILSWLLSWILGCECISSKRFWHTWAGRRWCYVHHRIYLNCTITWNRLLEQGLLLHSNHRDNAWHNVVGLKNIWYIVYETLLRHVFLSFDQVLYVQMRFHHMPDFEYKSKLYFDYLQKNKKSCPPF